MLLCAAICRALSRWFGEREWWNQLSQRVMQVRSTAAGAACRLPHSVDGMAWPGLAGRGMALKGDMAAAAFLARVPVAT